MKIIVFFVALQVSFLVETQAAVSLVPALQLLSKSYMAVPGVQSPVAADSPQGKCIIKYKGDLKKGTIPSLDGCNMCACMDNGQVACTMMACIKPKPLPPPIAANSTQGKCILDNKGDLKTGKIPSKDGCNTCSCSVNGTLACTKKACPKPKPPSPVPADSPKGKCIIANKGDLKTGKIPPKDCNSCFCSDSGQVACTLMACPKPIKPDSPQGKCIIENGGDLKTKRIPSKDGCNTCSCSVNGTLACTKKACPKPKPPSPVPADSPKGKCIIANKGDLKTGKIPSKDCNSCFCSDSGQVACSLMACPKPIKPDSPQGKCIIENGGDLKTKRIPSKDGCNSCVCSVKGTLSCTKKACPKPKPPSPVPADSPKGKCIIQYKGDLKTGKIPSKDCNSCFCSDDGQLACSLIACFPSNSTLPTNSTSPKQKCIQENGADPLTGMFPAKDGCNQCTCDGNGSFSCTEKGCIGGISSISPSATPSTTFYSTSAQSTSVQSTSAQSTSVQSTSTQSTSAQPTSQPTAQPINPISAQGQCIMANGGDLLTGNVRPKEGYESCSCSINGDLVCTQVVCDNAPSPTSPPYSATALPTNGSGLPVPAQSPRGQCILKNRGDLTTGRIPSPDNCNSCACDENGNMLCTTMACIQGN